MKHGASSFCQRRHPGTTTANNLYWHRQAASKFLRDTFFTRKSGFISADSRT
jgi:hypothetical protein